MCVVGGASVVYGMPVVTGRVDRRQVQHAPGMTLCLFEICPLKRTESKSFAYFLAPSGKLKVDPLLLTK